MVQFIAVSILTAYWTAGIAMAGVPAPTPNAEIAAIRVVEGSIGTASMEPDGTIVLRLITQRQNGPLGEGVLRYAPSDPQYHEILDHVGPIKPGETRPVAPWPD